MQSMMRRRRVREKTDRIDSVNSLQPYDSVGTPPTQRLAPNNSSVDDVVHLFQSCADQQQRPINPNLGPTMSLVRSRA